MGALSNIPGNPEKAYLMIETSGDTNTQSKALLKGLAQMNSLLSGGTPKSGGQDSFEVLQVQYNPSSLRFSVNAEPIRIKSPKKEEYDEEPAQASRPASVTLSAELIFEDIMNADVFMEDKFRLSAGDMAKDITGICRNIKKGGYSVQNQVNGLMALMLNKNTKTVTFQWADIAFRGIVEDVQARYTMFNLSGHPVMASVSLGIMQNLEEAAELKYWDKAFERCFQEAQAGGGKSLLSQAGNLVQFHI